MQPGTDIQKVPDNSAVRLELTDIGNSGVTGFQGSTLTPLPFQASVTDVDIKLGLAFKPTIPVGFEFADKLNAEVFVSMNLPRLDARLSTNQADNCGVGNSSNVTVPSPPFSNNTAPSPIALGPLALVEANVSLSVDVGVSLKLPLLPPPINDVGIDANIFSAVFPLIAGCVDAGTQMPPMTIPAEGWKKGNETITPSPCANETVYITSTTTQIKTIKMTHASSMVYVNSTAAVGSHVVKTTHVAPPPSAVTGHSTKLEGAEKGYTPAPILTTSLNATTSAASTSTPTSPEVPPALAASQPPVPTMIVSSGFLNGTGVPVQPTGAPATFTGGASPVYEVLSGNWRAVAWHMGLVGLGILGGGIVL